MRFEFNKTLPVAIFAFFYRISKQSVFDFPIPRFVRSDSFDASNSLKILYVFLDCSDAYPQNRRQLSCGYVWIVSDFRYDFVSIWRHPDIVFITNFITNHIDSIERDCDNY